jgi:hypothetical protein
VKLSDAFPKGTKFDLEVTVTVLNINAGKNRAIQERCRPLWEYSWFVDRIRKNQENGSSLKEAVNEALNAMPEEFVIRSERITQRVSVEEMLLEEFDEEKELAKLRRQYLKEGREEERKKIIFRFFSMGESVEKIAEFFSGEFTEQEILGFREEWEKSLS